MKRKHIRVTVGRRSGEILTVDCHCSLTVACLSTDIYSLFDGGGFIRLMGFWPGFRAAVRSCGSASSLNAYLTQVQITFFFPSFCVYTKITANSKKNDSRAIRNNKFLFYVRGGACELYYYFLCCSNAFLVHCTQKTFFLCVFLHRKLTLKDPHFI